MTSGVMRTTVRSRRCWRMISWPAANGIRWVKPSSATVSPSWTYSAIASSRARRSATRRPRGGRGWGLRLVLDHAEHVAQVEQVVLHRALGARGVALLDRRDQRLVLLDERGVDDGGLQDLDERRLHHLEDPVGEGL